MRKETSNYLIQHKRYVLHSLKSTNKNVILVQLLDSFLKYELVDRF